MKKILFISGHLRKKKYICSWQKGKKKEYDRKKCTKKKTQHWYKKKKYTFKNKKEKKCHNIESHWIYAIPAITYQYRNSTQNERTQRIMYTVEKMRWRSKRMKILDLADQFLYKKLSERKLVQLQMISTLFRGENDERCSSMNRNICLFTFFFRRSDIDDRGDKRKGFSWFFVCFHSKKT